ncbi:hypothetical protein HT665_00705 [Ursidibacter maritimus]|uniref:Pilus assembly protein PilP n=1 Tax=Ursidibacter maritimus TaxID=1331689 RepID=A0A949T046_9PAST|nr:hypothetical protein [Ursidibacter maritimus]KAE9540425.1 hypothetical protein A1D26_01700 [Ursidibacter maritimus]MBV6524717.1 hypothetical protein [Ursidibacter maritimus]MBV6525013.1 hypothetical protein [Ursidibacter maritimus]MBV6527215.1 hypothetical protein [Ursidibacter maritimus]MBV6530179.1 hypothetical protein [Ursidibacter maritimus]
MWKIGFILYSIPFLAYADPFYAENDHKNSRENIALAEGQSNEKKQQEISACLADTQLNKLSLPTPFSELRLIGIIKNQEIFTALFIDKQNHITAIKEKQILINEDIQFEKIDLKKIDYIDWKNSSDCDNPIRITISI